MGPDAEQLVRSIYDGWNGDDYESVAERLHPRVIWRPSGVLPGLDPVYHGRDGVRRFWEQMRDSWADIGITVDRAVAQGELALFSVSFSGAERGTGAAVQVSFTHVWQFEGELVTRCSAFQSVEEALLRAGELG